MVPLLVPSKSRFCTNWDAAQLFVVGVEILQPQPILHYGHFVDVSPSLSYPKTSSRSPSKRRTKPRWLSTPFIVCTVLLPYPRPLLYLPRQRDGFPIAVNWGILLPLLVGCALGTVIMARKYAATLFTGCTLIRIVEALIALLT